MALFGATAGSSVVPRCYFCGSGACPAVSGNVNCPQQFSNVATVPGFQQAVFRPEYSHEQMILMRLGYTTGPFQALHAHKLASGKMLVFVIANDHPVTLEDGDLFPSDQLITQLRLLAASQGDTK